MRVVGNAGRPDLGGERFDDLSFDRLHATVLTGHRPPPSEVPVLVEFVQKLASYDKSQASIIHRIAEGLASWSSVPTKGFGNDIGVNDCAHLVLKGSVNLVQEESTIARRRLHYVPVFIDFQRVDIHF